MNADDLKIWRTLTGRAMEVVAQLTRLAEFGADTSGDLLADTAALQTDIIALTDQIQDREARSWSDHALRPPAPRRLHGHPQSTEIDHGVHVERFAVTGRPVAEKPSKPAISGRWAANRRPKETQTMPGSEPVLTGHGHVRPRTDGVTARCGGPGLCRVCSIELTKLTNAKAKAAYLVHVAGEIQPDGSQGCSRCAFVILDAAPVGADRTLWGFPVGRRIVQGPVCTYLVAPDRELAPDEVPCR